jgi:hypothetical protein
MARKTEKTWITSKQAAAILSENNGHKISDRYVRRLAEAGKIETQELTERMKLYSKEDVEKCIVADRPGRKSARMSEQKREEAIA